MSDGGTPGSRSLGMRCGVSAAVGEERNDGVRGVPVEVVAGVVVAAGGAGSAWPAASWTSRRETPASRAAVTKACRRVCGLIRFFCGEVGAGGEAAARRTDPRFPIRNVTRICGIHPKGVR